MPRADYDHIGDLACANHLVFLPVRRKRHNRPHVIMGLSENLELVAWAELAMSASDSLCAIHPWNGFLYVMSAERSDELEAHDVRAFYAVRTNPAAWRRQIPMPRRDEALFRLKTPSGQPDRQGGQGVAFSPNGRIYVTRSHGDGPWNNMIYVYSGLTGRRFGEGREYDFTGVGDEIEGISHHPSGVLYVAVADNEWEAIDTDDFDLYTFRFRNTPPEAV